MNRLSRAAGLVSAATLVSRVLGVLRDSVRAALVGAGALSDALEVAFRIPNLLRDLFAEGAFTGAFVPTLAHAREHGGKEAAFALLNRVLGTMLLYVGAVVGLLILFAPQITRLLTSPDFAADFESTVRLVRILAPFLLLISVAVAAMGTLNVCGRFFLPALSPAMQNVILVAGGGILLLLRTRPEESTLPWALLLLGGGAAQFLVQVPQLWREGWRPRLSADPLLRTPEVRQILRRMGPVVFGLAATHLCVLINTRLASNEPGPISWLYYGFRLVHLPVGLVGVAVGTAVLAQASRQAATGDIEGVRRTLRDALLLTLAFALPAAVGLFVLAQPISQLLFQWRHVTVAQASAIAESIRCFSAAVVFYSAVKVVVPIFHARGQMRVPIWGTLAAVAANLACALGLYHHPAVGWRALALAVAAGQAANLAVLLGVARRLYGPPPREAAMAVARIAAASAFCAAAAWGTHLLLPGGSGKGFQVLRVGVPVLAGAAAYLLSGVAIGSREIRALLRRRRLDRAGEAG